MIIFKLSMVKNLLSFLISISLLLLPSAVFAASTSVEQISYARGHVTSIVREGDTDDMGSQSFYQLVEVKILDGAEEGKMIQAEYGTLFHLAREQALSVGDDVALQKNVVSNEVHYSVLEPYRLNMLLGFFLVFFLAVLFFGKLRGLSSFLGLIFSTATLLLFVVPAISRGYDAFWTILAGCVVIAFFSLYLAHGFNKRTTISLCATLATLALACIGSFLAVSLMQISGLGSEDTVYVIQQFPGIDFRGLFLGGMILGTLGVLDDITTGQMAVVDELRKANASLSFFELYRRALSVGREHIASLVNTLVLAYVGASFPLLLLFVANKEVPLWVTLNSEFILEEILRTLVGSSALVIAVPIATLMAAYFLSPRNSHQHSLTSS